MLIFLHFDLQLSRLQGTLKVVHLAAQWVPSGSIALPNPPIDPVIRMMRCLATSST
jgi:hypothetical protein